MVASCCCGARCYWTAIYARRPCRCLGSTCYIVPAQSRVFYVRAYVQRTSCSLAGSVRTHRTGLSVRRSRWSVQERVCPVKKEERPGGFAGTGARTLRLQEAGLLPKPNCATFKAQTAEEKEKRRFLRFCAKQINSYIVFVAYHHPASAIFMWSQTARKKNWKNSDTSYLQCLLKANRPRPISFVVCFIVTQWSCLSSARLDTWCHNNHKIKFANLCGYPQEYKLR